MLVEFFKHHRLPLRDRTLLVAASGGPDSFALLDMLSALRTKYGFKVLAAHLDHQLRPDSGKETILLKAYCRPRKVPLFVKLWPKKQHPETGIEGAARAYRYDFLFRAAKKCHADYLLTAHHGDDLLENILLKLIRSGNPAEMNSMLAVSKNKGVTLLRPLLSCSKNELIAYDRKHHLKFIEDSTNELDNTVRNRLRHHVIPLLKRETPALIEHAVNFSRQMSAYEEFLVPPQGEDFLGAIRIRESALTDYTLPQKQLLLSRMIWQKWHRRRQIKGKLLSQDLSGFCIRSYRGFLYIVNKSRLHGRTAKRIYTGRPFYFGGRHFLLSESQEEGKLIATFFSDDSDFIATNYVRFFLSRSRRRIKAKKKFAQHEVPAILRPSCLTILAGGRSVFTEKAYSNQVFSKGACLYYLYSL